MQPSRAGGALGSGRPSQTGSCPMSYQSLQNEREYRAALAEIDRIFDAEPGTAECERLRELSRLVTEYEAQNGDPETEVTFVPWVPDEPTESDALLRCMEVEPSRR